MDHIQIRIDMSAGTPIVRLGGKIIGDAVPEFEGAIRQLIKQDISRLVVDLQNVELLDSTGLGVLVGCYTSLKRRDGIMALAQVPPNIQQILHFTHLDTIFQIYGDSSAAIKAIGSEG